MDISGITRSEFTMLWIGLNRELTWVRHESGWSDGEKAIGERAIKVLRRKMIEGMPVEWRG